MMSSRAVLLEEPAGGDVDPEGVVGPHGEVDGRRHLGLSVAGDEVPQGRPSAGC